MKKNYYVWLFCALLLSGSEAWAQQKRSLTHEDYDGWESIGGSTLTKDGRWMGYQISPQEGDGRLEIVASGDLQKRYVMPRVKNWSFSAAGGFAVGKIEAEKDSIRMLKLRKKKEMPKDSLFILNLATGNAEKLPLVKSFSMPEENAEWLAILFEKEPAKTDPADSTKKLKTPKTDGTRLELRDLKSGTKKEFERVLSYGFTKQGDQFYYVQDKADTLKNTGLYLVDLKSGAEKAIDTEKTGYFGVNFSEEGSFLTYLTTLDSAKAKKPYYSLYLYEVKKGQLNKVADEKSPGLMASGRLDKASAPYFSKDEKRLHFGVLEDYKTFAYEEDTTILDEDRVKLDIWGWQDAEIQPMQLRNARREANKTFLAGYSIKDKRLYQIGEGELNSVAASRNATHPFGIATDDSPYRRSYSWDIQIGRDVYLVNLETGAKTLIGKNMSGVPQLSPTGNFAAWYDSRDSAWYGYEVKTGTIRALTKDLDVAFYNELHDSPSLPGSYGSGGWAEKDGGFIVYDKYDMWLLDPSGRQAPVNITKGEGRQKMLTFRRLSIEKEEEGFSMKTPMYLSAFHETKKDNGFYRLDAAKKASPQEILMSPHRYVGFAKAEEAEVYTVRRSTYQEFPNIYLTDANLQRMEQVTDANPWQTGIKWGSVELVDYVANDGSPLQGLLFKPEDFDANKKYPMMVYFYERNSDGLHSYRSPAPSASTVNIPYFVSNDYLVFVPDIKYELGLPGPSAFNCIIPGVQTVAAKGFVDTDNMAIQGQSWGGYQVAYLITQTNMFKAAGSGAPVVNMTSAYGGIRWGTGMSRMFQYEQTQSRIGGTLWEKPLYYIENSPLFYMDRVNTPVLIMHNDEDGAVLGTKESKCLWP
ncbi:peptidase S9 prolyl oligopeptidase active site domain-containing protein [Nitritalea halalkaliphila LW7]|uniref:Peptidase S9 prolyl oligopeptidase active site domain-containing protein n=1 Tax=Nitritalea halalkaliphila LW7 TaxID=1189621 RepID=I5C4P9_9BACT|nr:prolyl oligopeptidase family serine peptidase [Nitritalea halalkaliphila]EIM76801.1 peptidase S9 prolyl oligopeptidase active site domain-containing protein [Nitritalea halalkaliphila LW7]